MFGPVMLERKSSDLDVSVLNAYARSSCSVECLVTRARTGGGGGELEVADKRLVGDNYTLASKFPILSAHRAVLPDILGAKPLDNAVHVKRMIAHAPHRRTIISRNLTIRATRVERVSTNTTAIVFHIPFPRSDTMPLCVIKRVRNRNIRCERAFQSRRTPATRGIHSNRAGFE